MFSAVAIPDSGIAQSSGNKCRHNVFQQSILLPAFRPLSASSMQEVMPSSGSALDGTFWGLQISSTPTETCSFKASGVHMARPHRWQVKGKSDPCLWKFLTWRLPWLDGSKKAEAVQVPLT